MLKNYGMHLRDGAATDTLKRPLRRNEMSLKVKIIAILLLCIPFSTNAIAFENSHDFQVWKEYARGECIAYVRGIMSTAISFGTISLDLLGRENYENGCKESKKLQSEINSLHDEMYAPSALGAKNLDEYLPFIIDSIDHFYSDPLNRMFGIHEVIKICNMKAGGTDIDKYVAERRRSIIEYQKRREEFFKELNKDKSK